MNDIINHLKHLEKAPFSLVLRVNDAQLARRIIQASCENGFEFVEVTLTVPNAYEIISETRNKFPNVVVGAGTVQTLEQAQKVIAAGGQYLVSPTYSKEILRWSLQHDVLYVPGAMTVNEAYQIVSDGGSIIKFYPAVSIGPDFIKLCLNPFPKFKFFAAGGITMQNLNSWFEAGVIGVGITANLGQPKPNVTDTELQTAARGFSQAARAAYQKYHKG